MGLDEKYRIAERLWLQSKSPEHLTKFVAEADRSGKPLTIINLTIGQPFIEDPQSHIHFFEKKLFYDSLLFGPIPETKLEVLLDYRGEALVFSGPCLPATLQAIIPTPQTELLLVFAGIGLKIAQAARIETTVAPGTRHITIDLPTKWEMLYVTIEECLKKIPPLNLTSEFTPRSKW